MVIHKFEDVIAWQKAQDLAVNIYKVFRHSKDFGFRDQICRAAVSISNNIAEGFERNSNLDFKMFLIYSVSSCSEVKSMLYLAEKLDYISKEDNILIIEQTVEVSKIIRGLIKSMK